MKKSVKMIPVLALLASVGAALAGSVSDTSSIRKEAFVNGAWVDITGQQQNVHYQCTTASQNCTRELNEMGQVISLVEGKYSPL